MLLRQRVAVMLMPSAGVEKRVCAQADARGFELSP